MCQGSSLRTPETLSWHSLEHVLLTYTPRAREAEGHRQLQRFITSRSARAVHQNRRRASAVRERLINSPEQRNVYRRAFLSELSLTSKLLIPRSCLCERLPSECARLTDAWTQLGTESTAPKPELERTP